MNNRMKRSLIASSFLLSLAVILLGTTHTLGWFDNRINSPVELIEGQSTSAYFYDGKGTKENPYIITNRRHLYNLAWLQYIGHFNKSDESGVITPVNFKVATTDRVSGATTTDTKYVTPADIDCSGLVLPPIGTSQYPFVGIFAGNNSIIRNYTITDSSADMTNIPNEIKHNSTYIADGKLKHCSIIGTFGVVGLLDEKVKAVDSSNASTTFTISGDTKTSVSHFYIDQVNIKPTASNTLAGLIVGYANANVSYCGSYRSRIDFNAGTSKLPQKVSDSDAFSNVSSYTLIGDYNPDAVSWTDRPGKGQQNDWGGSIDISSLSKRITYIAKNSTETINPGKNPNTRRYVSSLFNSVIYTTPNSSNPGFSWDVDKSQSASFEDGTVLPLNIDLKKATIKSFDSSEQLGSFYNQGKAEPVLPGNTGYIVGTGKQGNAVPRLRHQRTDHTESSLGIQHSIYQQDVPNGKISDRNLFKNPGNFSLFYYDSTLSEAKTFRIVDEENSKTAFTYNNDQGHRKTVSDLKLSSRYSEVKAEFINMLNDGTTDSQIKSGYINLNGLLFNKVKETDTVPNTGSNLFKGGINFSTSSNGILTTVAGTFSSINDKHCFYDLYTIDKSSKTKKRIFKVYFNEKRNDSKYTFKSSETVSESGYELKIDLDKMRSQKLLDTRCAYYIQIPLNKGEYIMTSMNETTILSNFPYILYLDIGANAGDEEVTKSFSIEKIDFVYSNNQTDTKPAVHLITDKDYIASGVIFSMAGTSTSQTFYFYRLIESSGESTTVYYYGTTNNGLTITPTGKPVLDGKAHWTVS